MADIELVIKISEDSYKATCSGSMLPPDVKNVVNAIKNGTPRPKGHGDLIDRKILMNNGYQMEPVEMWYGMKYVDTIIEADAPIDHFESDCVNAEGINASQISDTLIKAYNSGLLTICGGMFDEKDVNECHTALMTAFKMLKTNYSKL